MRHGSIILAVFAISSFFSLPVNSFVTSDSSRTKSQAPDAVTKRIVLQATRYGPPSDFPASPEAADAESANANRIAQRHLKALGQLISQIDKASPDETPSILSQNVQFILSLEPQVMETYVLQNPYKSPGTMDLILSFAQDFVEEAKALDDKNKNLLGKIVRAISKGRENELDVLLKEQEFSPGFLRHLDGECERIQNAPKTTPDSLHLVQVLRTIQTRILEELGQEHLGDGALVLGQLVAYESPAERKAVLETGLVMRGRDFGMELMKLTQQALDDFDHVDADPELVSRIKEIHEGINKFLSQGKEKRP